MCCFKYSIQTPFMTLNEANTFLTFFAAGSGLFQKKKTNRVNNNIARTAFRQKVKKETFKATLKLINKLYQTHHYRWRKENFSASQRLAECGVSGAVTPLTNRQQTQINHNFLRIAGGEQANKRTNESIFDKYHNHPSRFQEMKLMVSYSGSGLQANGMCNGYTIMRVIERMPIGTS